MRHKQLIYTTYNPKTHSCNELQAQRYTSNPYIQKNRKRGSQTTIEQSTLFMNHDRIFKILA